MRIRYIKEINHLGTLRVVDSEAEHADNVCEILIRTGFAVEVDQKPSLTAVEVSELISKIDNIEDLDAYKNDKRQVVKLAYKKKLRELNG